MSASPKFGTPTSLSVSLPLFLRTGNDQVRYRSLRILPRQSFSATLCFTPQPPHTSSYTTNEMPSVSTHTRVSRFRSRKKNLRKPRINDWDSNTFPSSLECDILFEVSTIISAQMQALPLHPLSRNLTLPPVKSCDWINPSH